MICKIFKALVNHKISKYIRRESHDKFYEINYWSLLLDKNVLAKRLNLMLSKADIYSKWLASKLEARQLALSNPKFAEIDGDVIGNDDDVSQQKSTKGIYTYVPKIINNFVSLVLIFYDRKRNYNWTSNQTA